MLGNHIQQGFLHILGHVVGIATHIEVGTRLKPGEQLCTLFTQSVLHINLVGLIPAESQEMFDSRPLFT